jgi:hypothetical protein
VVAALVMQVMQAQPVLVQPLAVAVAAARAAARAQVPAT